MNIYEELYLVNESNLNSTYEFELSSRIKNLIEKFIKEKYNTNLSNCGCDFDEETCRVVVIGEKNYFDKILGGTGNGKRENEFKQFVKKRGY